MTGVRIEPALIMMVYGTTALRDELLEELAHAVLGVEHTPPPPVLEVLLEVRQEAYCQAIVVLILNVVRIELISLSTGLHTGQTAHVTF